MGLFERKPWAVDVVREHRTRRHHDVGLGEEQPLKLSQVIVRHREIVVEDHDDVGLGHLPQNGIALRRGAARPDDVADRQFQARHGVAINIGGIGRADHDGIGRAILVAEIAERLEQHVGPASGRDRNDDPQVLAHGRSN